MSDSAEAIADDFRAEIAQLKTLLAHQQAAVAEEAYMNDSLRRKIERLTAALRECADAVAPANADFAEIKARARAALEEGK